MNSNGDPQGAHARARVPGPPPAPTPDGGHADHARHAPDAYRRSTSGRAGVSGSVPRGAASVGPGSLGGTSGRASVGSARVGAPVEPGYGTRGAVARAAVRPSPPPGSNPPGPPVRPGAGGARAKGKDPKKAAKRRRRNNILTAAAAVVVILAGAGVVAGTWFFDDVQLTEPKAEDQVTQLLTADGKAQLATIGQQNRQLVPAQQINPIIGEAVMGAEDKNFLNHHGIDMKGIMRAAWNNFTGGDTQGASTITQQYARHAAELKEISYNRKLREAVLARKMEDVYSKQEILGRYLNSVYFGRGAYGIEAAVKAYFGSGRSALTPPGQKGAITAGEAAILAAVIKQPEPVKGGHQGYDPQNNLSGAIERWNYTLGNMVEKGWLNAQDRPAAYPKTWKKFDPNACRTTCGNDKPTGKIIKYVKQELLAMGIQPSELNTGGLRITTTIDPRVQKAAEEAVNPKNGDSPMHALKSTYKSALVAVNPTNGRVLAYYGGPQGDRVGWDYAGPNYSDKGAFVGGGRPPGSTFKIYTLAAGLTAGYGFDTTWDSTIKRIGGDTINNSSRTNLKCDKRRCPLETATVESYNFPFYWLANKIGAPKVLDAAHAAGVQYIANPNKIGQRVDLSTTDAASLKEINFGDEVGFGQYAITPLDHANGIATLANDGMYNKAHFVVKVEKRDQKTGKFTAYHNEQIKTKPVFDKNVVAAIDNVLEKIPGHNNRSLKGGRDAIAKTGTWEYKDGKSGENGDAWTIGATRQVAAAVWVGNYDKANNPLPIKTADGKNMSGGSVPGAVWKLFMDLASQYIDAPEEGFLPNVNVGNPEMKGNGLPPEAPKDPQPGCLLGALFCPGGNNGGNGTSDNGGQDNGGGDNGGGDGNQGGGVGPTLPGQGGGNDTTGGGGQNQNQNQLQTTGATG
jgi:membrane peptidoglycan carboxypeptidase